MAVVKTINVAIQATTTGFEKGLQSARSRLNSFVQNTLGAVGQLAGVSLGIYGVGSAMRSMIGTSEEFAKSMAQSTAIMSGVTDGLRADLETAAKQVAFHTTFSAEEAAKAYFYLASAGLDAQQSLASMPIVAKFAQAGMFDLALATELASDAQSAMGLASKDPIKNMESMARVTDVLVMANNIANGSVEQFAIALTNHAGPALKIAGKSIEEGVAVLAVFANQGIKAEEAGTALSIVMRDLQTQALANKQAFIDTGVAVFDAEGNMRNVATIIRDLENATNGLSDASKKQLLFDLGFTDKSVNNIQALIGASAQIADYEARLREAGGITAHVAEKNIPEFTRSLNQLKATWEAFSIDVGGGIIDALVESGNGISRIGTILATVVDVGHAFYLGWLAVKPAIIAVMHPIDAIKIAIADLGFGLTDLILKAAQMAKSLGATSVGESLEVDALRAQQAFAEMATSAIPTIKEMDAASQEFMQAFLQDTPGQKFLETLEKMQQPLADIRGSVTETADAITRQHEALAEVEAKEKERATALKKQEDEEKARMERLKERGKSLTEEFSSPIEKFADKVGELQKLRDMAFIDDATFSAAFQDARNEFTSGLADEFEKNNVPVEAVKGPAAIEGPFTNAAFSAFQEAKRGQDMQKQQTEYQKKMERHLNEMVRRGVVLAAANFDRTGEA